MASKLILKMDPFWNDEEDQELAKMLDSESYKNWEQQSQIEDDHAFAELLMSQYAVEDAHSEVTSLVPPEFITGSPAHSKRNNPKNLKHSDKENTLSIIAPEWEDLDPTPDLHALFIQYNDRFFWGRLSGCEVKWSPRMTSCAGVCSYQGRGGLCSVRLSLPLLKLRPRKDLVETLLHEMIHAYLFVTDGNDDHDGHGPAFHKHMYRINNETGTKISVYHNFHDEVALYKQHWWKCNGPCVNRKPFYGMVKRSMNRAPGPSDFWWETHRSTCGGTYIKVKEPDGYKKKSQKSDVSQGQSDIRSFGKSNGKSNKPGEATTKGDNGKSDSNKLITTGGGKKGNIFGFGGTSFNTPSNGMIQTKGRAGTHTINSGSKAKDNSSGGQAVQIDNFSSNSKNESSSSDIMSKFTANRLGSSDSGRPISSISVVNLEDTPDKVRQHVRNIWASKQSKLDNVESDDTSKSNFQGSQHSSSKIQPNLKQKTLEQTLPIPNKDTTAPSCSQPAKLEATCPVCGKNVSKSIINSHLDKCLGVTPEQSSSQSNAPGIKRKSPFHNPFIDDSEEQDIHQKISAKEDDSLQCPICNRQILKAEIDYHVNMCIDK